MNCPRCKAPARADWKYCAYCHVPLPAQTPAPEPEPEAAPSAGAPAEAPFVFQPPDPDVLVRQALKERLGPVAREIRLDAQLSALWFEAREVTLVTLGLHPLNLELSVRSRSDAAHHALELLRRTAEAVRATGFGSSPRSFFLLQPPIVDVSGAFLVADPVAETISTALADLSLLNIVGIAADDVREIFSFDGGPLAVAEYQRRRADFEQTLLERPRPWLVAPGNTHVFHPRKRTRPTLSPSLSPVERAWVRIETWLDDQRDGLSQQLPRGASASELASLERETGAPLPEDVRASWMRHDGEGELSGLFGAYRLITAAQMRAQLAETRAAGESDWSQEDAIAHGPVRADGWNPMWIPITDGEGRYYLCIDLDPPPTGRRGQVIGIDRHRDRMFHAASWTAYLDELAGELEAGAYRWDEEDGLVSQRVIR